MGARVGLSFLNLARANHKMAENGEMKLPFSFARRFGVLAVAGEAGTCVLYCRKDAEAAALQEARRFLGRVVAAKVVEAAEYDRRLRELYEAGPGSDLETVEIDEDLDLDNLAASIAGAQEILENDEHAPVIRLMNGLLARAVRMGASDIHIEPFEKVLRVRFRIDGVLRTMLEPQLALAPLLAARIKVMSRLDIAEKRLPQDGRISILIAGRPVDVRVSTIPAAMGERVVLRILDKQDGRLDLEQLGMEGEVLAGFNTLLGRADGIVLVTGPTGSGKTTTLYAALARLNKQSRNIMTVEDPIEYHLEGIGQSQVNMKTGMTYAKGLRAILRQDPDVVMVGEVRDIETAEIAVQASLTGHLVFSTLHTSTAVGALTRLRDMGVESYLLSSSLAGVLAQRLVRRLCPECKRPRPVSKSEAASIATRLGGRNLDTVWEAAGCPTCDGQGYHGRIGIFELLILDDELREMVHQGASEQLIAGHQARRSILDAGIDKVAGGETSLVELLRVLGGTSEVG